MRPTRMTKAMTLVALAGALTISACGGGDKPAKSSAGGSQGSGASAPAAVKVNIASFKFLPKTVSVKAGRQGHLRQPRQRPAHSHGLVDGAALKFQHRHA